MKKVGRGTGRLDSQSIYQQDACRKLHRTRSPKSKAKTLKVPSVWSKKGSSSSHLCSLLSFLSLYAAHYLNGNYLHLRQFSGASLISYLLLFHLCFLYTHTDTNCPSTLSVLRPSHFFSPQSYALALIVTVIVSFYTSQNAFWIY